MPQCIILRRLSISLVANARTSRTSPRPTTLPISSSTDRTLTEPSVIGCRFMFWPALSTQILTLLPARSPVLAGTSPRLVCPDGARHLPGTQKLAIDP